MRSYLISLFFIPVSLYNMALEITKQEYAFDEATESRFIGQTAQGISLYAGRVSSVSPFDLCHCSMINSSALYSVGQSNPFQM